VPCYHPLKAFRGRSGGVVFKKEDSCGVSLDLPCGQCIGCRLERSRQWAVRIMHEASLHESNYFVTLTYSPEHLPADLSLNKRHWQLFAKRLRKRVGPFRFFHCGEYGEQSARPHYHACLFGIDFPDKVFYSESGGNRLYTSELLDSLWSHGDCKIGDLTFESAAYVARYIMKKVTGVEAPGFYEGRRPEYVTMSRRPGIGRAWYDKFRGDVYPDDFVVVNGMKMRPPKFYDSLYEVENPSDFKRLKSRRVLRADPLDNDSFRLPVKEFVKKSRIKSLMRSLEVGHDH